MKDFITRQRAPNDSGTSTKSSVINIAGVKLNLILKVEHFEPARNTKLREEMGPLRGHYSQDR